MTEQQLTRRGVRSVPRWRFGSTALRSPLLLVGNLPTEHTADELREPGGTGALVSRVHP